MQLMNRTKTHLFGGALFSAGLTADTSTKRRGRKIAAALVATSSLLVAPAALADIIHVPDDFPTIQGAIDASQDGDEIIVAPGTFVETIDFLGKAIRVRSSHGAEATTIDGDQADAVVRCASGEERETILQGFTITDGQDGMSIAYSHPTIINCTFTGNSDDGMDNDMPPHPDGLGSVTFPEALSEYLTLINCTFTGNGGEGAHSYDLRMLVINCVFADNGGSGVSADGYPTLWFYSCIFAGNGGYGIDFQYGSVTNCIVWDNGLGFEVSDYAKVRYSDVEGGWPGDGNIDADPLFVDPDKGDFRLSQGSPCIDAGDNAFVEACRLDLDGRFRRVDDRNTRDTGLGDPPILDMGAYEFGSPLGEDCNNNVFDDDCEVAEGSTPDCNRNGSPDDCDIADGFSLDCNGNGIPDECEPPDDCNGNGVQDICDLADGFSEDCNDNGVPDECDIANEASEDCNGNGAPDECDSAHTVDDSFNGAHSVYAADVDGDGDMDVLGAASNADRLTWWENTAGDGSVWTEHTVDGDFGGAQSVYAADVDGDGDLDVLGAARYADDITWWENTAGDGSAWIEHAVDGDFHGAHSVYAADVDGDGDMDVLGAAESADDITWWENTAGDGAAWTEHPVDGSFNGARSVYAADVDGDGDMDVLGAASFDDDITWWENTAGDGTVWTEHTVDGDFDDARSVYAADVDGDGDMDVLGAADNADDITWWENTAGDGAVWIEHAVDGDFDGAQSVYAADVDDDGDMDILGAAGTADDITWWENTAGDGSTWIEHTVDSNFDFATSVYAADVDGDGNLDVLGAAGGADDISWWKNLGCAGNGCSADLDGDGDVDASDLIALIGAWGPCGGCAACPADLHDDCVVNGVDLLILLGAWGPCP